MNNVFGFICKINQLLLQIIIFGIYKKKYEEKNILTFVLELFDSHKHHFKLAQKTTTEFFYKLIL